MCVHFCTHLHLMIASKLSEERRSCRFRHDIEGLKLFKQYSQSACQFECQIEMATKKCGCVPWDYPHLNTSGLSEVCEGWGRYCFENVLKDTNRRLANCKYCLPDCIITRYEKRNPVLFSMNRIIGTTQNVIQAIS